MSEFRTLIFHLSSQNPISPFSNKILTAIRDGKILGIRAGTAPHRFIGIWAVVVDDRVFVRSWSRKPRSWYRTFLQEPPGAMSDKNRFPPT
ncbi:MAG: DUF2255 family protein [candidate division KSB1 bacterium]|nr:DUF2255 family protein [candidate division KSB1 bacterium]MDZ7368459.1 DUF2255 family protein [candidate division KSB1 bacterium]MDZ7406185.1 DUF2255 family protein [candidate division KSB1 bacterium]